MGGKKNRGQYWYDRDIRIIHKDFEATMIKMLQWAIMNSFETNEKTRSLSKEIESLVKEIENIRAKWKF